MSDPAEGIYQRGYKIGFKVGIAKALEEKKPGEGRMLAIECARDFLNETSMNDKKISRRLHGMLKPEEIARLRKGEDLS